MKNAIYVISALLIVIWAIVFFGFNLYQHNSYRIVHLILIAAVGLLLFEVIRKNIKNNR